MTRCRTLIAGFLLFAPLIGGASAASVPLPGSRDRWRSMSVGGFLVFSDASASEMRALATNLSQMRQTFAQISTIDVRSAQPIDVFLFEDTKEFAPYRDAILGRSAQGVAGVFVRAPDGGDVIILDGQRREAGQSVAYHELTHFFVANNAPNIPLWLNEGLAEFNSTFETTGTTAKIGLPVLPDMAILRTQHRLPLRRLFEVTQDSPEYTETGHAGMFYAESWALVHYVLTGPLERRKQLGRFVDLLNQHHPLEEAFRSSFGSGFEQLETELDKHIWRASLPYAIVDLGAAAHTALPNPEPMPRDELLFQLGSLLTKCRDCDRADARRFLAEALAFNANHAAAAALLARLSGPPAGKLRRPVPSMPSLPEAPPSDTVAAERIVVRLLGRPAPWSEADRAELLRARQLFEIETVREPASTRAYNGLAETYSFPGEDADLAIGAYEKSLAIDPKQGAVLKNVVHLCANHGQRDRALALIARLTDQPTDREVHDQCQDILAIADGDAGERLIGEGRVDDGLAVLERGFATATNPELRARLHDELSRIRGQLERQRQVDLFNSAAAKAREGDLVGAYRLVESLLATASDPEVVERAKRLRERIAPYVINASPKP